MFWTVCSDEKTRSDEVTAKHEAKLLYTSHAALGFFQKNKQSDNIDYVLYTVKNEASPHRME